MHEQHWVYNGHDMDAITSRLAGTAYDSFDWMFYALPDYGGLRPPTRTQRLRLRISDARDAVRDWFHDQLFPGCPGYDHYCD
jgi:hypothetical protein